MITSVSIAIRELYTTAGEYDTQLYAIQATTDDDFMEEMELESIDDMVTLRDALTAFINRHSGQQTIVFSPTPEL